MNTIFAFLRKVTTGFLTEDVRNAIETVVDFILLSYVVAVIILAATLGYQKWEADLNKPWATQKGVEVRSKEEFQQAIRFHGSGARLCEWDNKREAWVFYRDGKPCRVFAYLEKKK